MSVVKEFRDFIARVLSQFRLGLHPLYFDCRAPRLRDPVQVVRLFQKFRPLFFQMRDLFLIALQAVTHRHHEPQRPERERPARIRHDQ